MNTNQRPEVRKRKQNSTAVGLSDGLQHRKKIKTDIDDILFGKLEAENDECDEYDKKMTKMMKKLKLKREEKSKEQI
ncbi:hypothetical protein EAF04_000169 [Stromatinia cepivora]|nr:hypothetical protein EAF04_000169 [Stromatinia cepivora]